MMHVLSIDDCKNQQGKVSKRLRLLLFRPEFKNLPASVAFRPVAAEMFQSGPECAECNGGRCYHAMLWHRREGNAAK